MVPTHLSGEPDASTQSRMVMRSTDDEDRTPAASYEADEATGTFVRCAACGRPHVGELRPPTPSFCVQCVEAVENADDPYIEYGGSD